MKPPVVLLGALLAAGAWSGQRADVRWPPDARIGVWIAASPVRKDDPAFVERAMRVWTQAAGGQFALGKAAAENAAQIRIRFGTGEDLLGETSPVVDQRTGFLAHADIAIAANLPGDRLQQHIVIYMTALHELGHALGLRHSSAFDDIMYFFRRPEDPEQYFGAFRRRLRSESDIGSPRATGLSARDLEELRAIYR